MILIGQIFAVGSPGKNKKQYHQLLNGCQTLILFSQLDWFSTHRISGGILQSCNVWIQVVQECTENEFSLESTISAFHGPFEYLYSLPLYKSPKSEPRLDRIKIV